MKNLIGISQIRTETILGSGSLVSQTFIGDNFATVIDAVLTRETANAEIRTMDVMPVMEPIKPKAVGFID